jgi:protein-tyrosine-phosphatase
MAEAIARKEAGDIIVPFSAGVYPLGMICATTRVVLEANEYPAEELVSKGLREFAPQDVDLVINMSGLVEQLAEAGYRFVEHWEVADPYGAEEGTYQTILEEIQGRVRNLADQLRQAQRAKGKPE